MAPHSSLLVCPKNLKECIDWVLRATGKDNLKGTKDNINNLKNALMAELNGSGLTVELDPQLNALASGLGFLAGLPACLCKTKKSVKEGLQKIYEELKTFNYCISKLNCDSCSIENPCKCCVIQSIKEVKGSCECLQPNGNKSQCHCNGQKVSCSKVLAGLEACLHLQCLQSDMNEICQCSGDTCCLSGKCNGTSGVTGGGSCDFCQNLNAGKSVPTTGLGLSPPNPIRLAGRLEKFFGNGPGPKSSGCSCKCGSDKSCCCLACPGNCSQACSCVSTGQCDHGSSQECPCKEFCQNINSIQVSSGSSLMKCCDSGNQCHCKLGSSKCSGQCCKEHNKQSLKCMIRRLVLYFKDLKSDISSPSKQNFKNCCELMCVLKTCEFLNNFLGGNGSEAQKFKNHLETLRFAGPCGQDLWRTLDDFLNFICYVFWPKANVIRVALENLHKQKCKQCKSGSCTCASGSSGCPGCTAVLEKLQTHKDVLSLMTQGYSSAYSEASWDSLTSSGSGSKCCGSSGSPSCSCPSSCSPSGSCPSQCCPDCPQRKAAKIFLEFIPCMYWGLKIVFDRCKENSGFAGWHDISILSGKPSSDLAKFLQAWGYDVRPLKTKKGFEFPPMLENLFGSDSSGPLQKLSTLVTENYFTSNLISSGSLSPSTVREMLLWLYGLRFQRHFSDIVENCKSLCSPFGNSFNSDAFC
ncbi:variant erythrocyte surface antigen-1, beta subunit, partial [Babesia divergens]